MGDIKNRAPKKTVKKDENTELLEQQIRNAAVLARLLTEQNQGQVSAQAMVGIRNISDMTVGERGAFGAPDIHLYASSDKNDPNTVTVIPYAWWRELRKGKLVGNGVIMRDDSVMGQGYMHAPEDRPEDLAPGHTVNAIEDPKEWIESRTEAQIRADLPKITSINSLRRIRRAVDDKIRQVAEAMPDIYRDHTAASNGFVPKGGWDQRKVRALEELPALYRLVDDMTTRLIEAMIP